MQQWANVANINFIEVQEPHTQGDMRFTFSSLIDDKDAVGYSPSPAGIFFESSGDVWINPDVSDLQIGSPGFLALVHQIGFALGLKPTNEMNEMNDEALFGLEDTSQYTIMSDNAYEEAGWQEGPFLVEPVAPMLYDILAIQFLYGKNITTNSNDTLYQYPEGSVLETVWDTGGIDTFDLSNQNLDSIINLNAGEFSSIGDIVYEMNNNGELNPISQVAVDNITIAYGVEIENAIGGNGDDEIIGNHLANRIIGGNGDDYIEGNKGIDTVIYTENSDLYTIETNENTLFITLNDSSNETDTLDGIERLQFNDVTLAMDINGNAGQAYRLYQAAFNRTPDKNGLGFWIDSLDKGESLEKVSVGFIQSQEFSSLYGENLTDNLFLSSLYNNVLHRELDAEGGSFWMNQLQVQPRENVLIGFSESNENQLQIIGDIQNGIELIT
ncbi:MAG: DUF4214 domain-containing protein [Methylococcales bacterium]|nr:DUF4214 domain-containing protein [Methylococcales bacterium]